MGKRDSGVAICVTLVLTIRSTSAIDVEASEQTCASQLSGMYNKEAPVVKYKYSSIKR